MTILLRIEQAGPKGLALEELIAASNDQLLVLPRLDDLVTGKLVSLRQGRYAIGRRGVLLVKTHMFCRTLLKRGKGG
ncbi:MAG: hypothetical protein HYY46_26160 [Deltaproteobacteria bacterium]|nr:hypothetical protein [Deltaproteobacteria bacterium]